MGKAWDRPHFPRHRHCLHSAVSWAKAGVKPDVIAVTPVYPPVMEGLEGAETVHRLFEAQDRKAFSPA